MPKHQNMALALKAIKAADANVPINPNELVRELRDTNTNAFLYLNDVKEKLSHSQ